MCKTDKMSISFQNYSQSARDFVEVIRDVLHQFLVSVSYPKLIYTLPSGYASMPGHNTGSAIETIDNSGGSNVTFGFFFKHNEYNAVQYYITNSKLHIYSS